MKRPTFYKIKRVDLLTTGTCTSLQLLVSPFGGIIVSKKIKTSPLRRLIQWNYIVCWHTSQSNSAISPRTDFFCKSPCRNDWVENKQSGRCHDLGKDPQDANGCMRNNKPSLISQFSRMRSAPVFTEQVLFIRVLLRQQTTWCCLLDPHLISANVQLFKVSFASLICFKAEEK